MAVTTENIGENIGTEGRVASFRFRLGKGLGRAWIGWVLPVAILILWEALSRAGLIRANVLPAPSAVLTAFWELLLSGKLLGHIGVSTARALAGFAIGGAIGFALGLALARALVGEPKILTLDEPLGALDALTRIEMQSLLERIWREKGFTAVLVTHDVAEAVILADRVVVLEEGRIALDMTIDLPRPRPHGSPEVAAYEQQILDQLFNEAAA